MDHTAISVDGCTITPGSLADWRAGRSGFPAELADFLESWWNDSPAMPLQTSGSTGKPKTIHATKAAMAYVCAQIAWGGKQHGAHFVRNCVASVIGALTYVALYMLKTFIFQAYVYHYPMSTVWATMLSKFIPSIINAGFAMVVTPVIMRALHPMLRATGMLEKMRG